MQNIIKEALEVQTEELQPEQLKEKIPGEEYDDADYEDFQMALKLIKKNTGEIAEFIGRPMERQIHEETKVSEDSGSVSIDDMNGGTSQDIATDGGQRIISEAGVDTYYSMTRRMPRVLNPWMKSSGFLGKHLIVCSL